jgi:hypothetical protein
MIPYSNNNTQLSDCPSYITQQMDDRSTSVRLRRTARSSQAFALSDNPRLFNRYILHGSSSVQVLIIGNGSDEFCLGVVPDMNASCKAIYRRSKVHKWMFSKSLPLIFVCDERLALSLFISTTFVAKYTHYPTYRLNRHFNTSSLPLTTTITTTVTTTITYGASQLQRPDCTTPSGLQSTCFILF